MVRETNECEGNELKKDLGISSPNDAQSCIRCRSQRGYILLTLVLFVALMIVATAVVVPGIAFEIRRAREEELVHRGVQYTRAIRRFSKRNGRYPNRVEELLGGSDLRYIRKLYKDPITGGDFRMLHLDDIQANSAPVQRSDGQTDFAVNPASYGGSQPRQPADPSPDSSSASGTSFGQSAAPSLLPPGLGQTAASLSGAPLANASGAELADSPAATPGPDGPQPGLLIFGVASTSKAHSIRAFDHKEHYNEWWFFYDPRFDRGFEIKGPTSMTLSTFANPVGSQESPNGGQSIFQQSQLPQAQPQPPATEAKQNQQQ